VAEPAVVTTNSMNSIFPDDDDLIQSFMYQEPFVAEQQVVCKTEPENRWGADFMEPTKSYRCPPTASPQLETKRLSSMDAPVARSSMEIAPIARSSMDSPVGRTQFPNSIRGETRLNITFFGVGNCGEIPQRFGKNMCGIPDGLSGTHEMYDQRWKFEVRHQRQGNLVLITWKVINLTSKTVLTVTETPQDAMVRENCGRTICNMVLRTALENRAKELQMSLSNADPQTRSSRMTSTENLIRVLRPKRCTVGLLFFGLLHEKVQRNFASQIAKMGLE